MVFLFNLMKVRKDRETSIAKIPTSIEHFFFYLFLVFQISDFVCPKIQQNCEPINLLMSVGTEINAVTLKLNLHDEN